MNGIKGKERRVKDKLKDKLKDKEWLYVNLGTIVLCIIILIVLICLNVHSINTFTDNRASMKDAEEQSGVVIEVIELGDDLLTYLFEDNKSITVSAKENMKVDVGESIKYKTYQKKVLLKSEPEEVTRITHKEIKNE